jgi:hypothetical protein
MRGVVLLLGITVFIPLTATCFLHKASSSLFQSPLQYLVEQKWTNDIPNYEVAISNAASDPRQYEQGFVTNSMEQSFLRS